MLPPSGNREFGAAPGSVLRGVLAKVGSMRVPNLHSEAMARCNISEDVEEGSREGDAGEFLGKGFVERKMVGEEVDAIETVVQEKHKVLRDESHVYY